MSHATLDSIVPHIHVNIIKLRNITCTLVATDVILRSLVCTYTKSGNAHCGTPGLQPARPGSLGACPIRPARAARPGLACRRILFSSSMTSIRERHGGWFLSPSLLALIARSLASSSASSFWCGPACRSAHWAGATWQRSSTTSLSSTNPEASSSTRLYAYKQFASYITLSHSYYCYVGESIDMIHLSRFWKLIGMWRKNPLFHLAQNLGPCKSGSASIYSRIAQF